MTPAVAEIVGGLAFATTLGILVVLLWSFIGPSNWSN
jgi:hypothetical protein